MTKYNESFKDSMPRERLREKGACYLGDEELLAILLGTGTRGQSALELARQILEDTGGVARIRQYGLGALSAYGGMGVAKSARIMAALELGLRMVEQAARNSDLGRLSCSRDIFKRYGVRLGCMPQEVFMIVGLNNKNEIIREEIVAKGSVDECRVNPREVFRPLIAEACARMVALHNHPSGDPSPSPEDLAVTRRLEQTGFLVGIPLLDHLVIGAGKYVSIRDLGILASNDEWSAKPLGERCL